MQHVKIHQLLYTTFQGYDTSFKETSFETEE